MLYLIMNLQNGTFGHQTQLKKITPLQEHVHLFKKKEMPQACDMFYIVYCLDIVEFFIFYSEEAVHASEQVMVTEPENSGRNKRQAGVGPPDPYGFSAAKTRCPLLLVADYRFFREMGGGSTKTTINYLV